MGREKIADTALHSRGAFASELCIILVPLEKRGRREDRVFCAPAASYAVKERIRVSHHRSAETIRPSLRDGVNAYTRALPGVRDLIVTVTCRSPAGLALAQGCQDHTTSQSASNTTRQSMWQASIATRLAFVTTRTPLLSRRDRANEAQFSEKRKENL
jgi:hypothetical protein